MSSAPARGGREWLLPAAPLLVAGTVQGILLIQTPAFSFDEGVYVARAVDFVETGRLYATGFWDHPFLGWAFLGLAFRAIGFPGILAGGAAAPPSFLEMWAVPRAFMVLLALASAVLVCRIARILTATNRQALIAMAFFALTTFSAYYRMVLIDNIGNVFVLAAVLLALEAKVRARPYLFLGLSGGAFGLALLTKLSFVAFLPLFVVILIWGVRSKSPARGPIGSRVCT